LERLVNRGFERRAHLPHSPLREKKEIILTFGGDFFLMKNLAVPSGKERMKE
jgi:hypothetical protein